MREWAQPQKAGCVGAMGGRKGGREGGKGDIARPHQAGYQHTVVMRLPDYPASAL